MRAKVDDIDLVKLEELKRNGLTDAQIADYFGICPKTLYNFCKRHKPLADALKRGKSQGIAFVANKLFEKIQDGDTSSIIFYLKTQGGWSEKQELELSSKADQPLKLQIINDLKM